jgi:hypothetical protein
MNCCICNIAIKQNQGKQHVYYERELKPAHFLCGVNIFEKKIDVYKITLGGSSYIDQSLDTIFEMLKEASYGEVYKIEKIRMKHQDYHTLQEFHGF